jgi:membrane-associated phospholipid phosphatase
MISLSELFGNKRFRPHLLGVIALILTCAAMGFLPCTSNLHIKSIAHVFSGKGNTSFLVLGYLALIIAAIVAKKYKGVWQALLVCISVTIAVHIVKFAFGHFFPRPSGHLGGFPSGHSAASFALAFLLTSRFPKLGFLWFAIAICISWSRVLVDAHYPYQVAGGMVLGLIVVMLLQAKVIEKKAEASDTSTSS